MYFFEKKSQFANHLLFCDDHGKNITYQYWYDCAAALQLIVPQRTLVFILCRNTIGSALSYLCCLQNHIVPILLDEHINEALLNNLLQLYKPSFIFKPTTENSTGTPLYTLVDYGLYAYEQQEIPLYQDLALLLTTSGSTGSPKLVRQSYENIQANANSIGKYLELTAAQRPVTSLPMHYTFGLSVINSHVNCGAAIYLTEATIFDGAFWDFCRTREITSLAGVPFTYECLKKLGFFNMDLPAMELLIQAGGKLSKTLQKEYAEFSHSHGKRFFIMYGQTEATARMSYLPVAYNLSKPGSIGIPIPGGKFRIMEDEHTEITAANKAGELYYEGLNVTLGYATCAADLNLGDERRGLLPTGDIAYRDEDGFYYISGRKKRFIKILGSRVNMDEVEQLLKNRFPDYDFACTGQDDALHIFTTQETSTDDTITDMLIDTLNFHPTAFHIHSVKAIPKNASGKTQYTELAKKATGQ